MHLRMHVYDINVTDWHNSSPTAYTSCLPMPAKLACALSVLSVGELVSLSQPIVAYHRNTLIYC